jgi:hypothetical protein
MMIFSVYLFRLTRSLRRNLRAILSADQKVGFLVPTAKVSALLERIAALLLAVA